MRVPLFTLCTVKSHFFFLDISLIVGNLKHQSKDPIKEQIFCMQRRKFIRNKA